MRVKYSIFAGAVALGLAMAPAALARGGGGVGGMHGGGFGGMHVGGFARGAHVGGFAGGFHDGVVHDGFVAGLHGSVAHDGFHGNHMVYGRERGLMGYGLIPYYDEPAFCSQYPGYYNPAVGCYG